MSNKFKPHQQVYAVVRLDFYGTALPEHTIPEGCVRRQTLVDARGT